MNLHWIDWTIVGAALAGLLALACIARRYMRSVSDFLAANRMAGRYIVSVSNGFGGAISMVALWEMTYANGLPAQWGMMLMGMVGLCITISGFVTYRLRETRCLTTAQFFEMRYSRRFRVFAGALCCLSGFLNYGIFPAVTARFMLVFFGFPDAIAVCGLSVPVYPLVMAAYLSIAVFIACSGGQISIILTDFFQGMIMLAVFVVVMLFFFVHFDWETVMAGLRTAPEGASLINPFKTGSAGDFNVVYFLIGVMSSVYTVRAWQAKSAGNAAAKSPHEGVMAGIVSNWRELVCQLCMVLIPLAAYAVMHGSSHPEIAAAVNERLAEFSDPVIRTQMTVPVFLAKVFPVGLFGLFAFVICASAISTDDMYMHAWGTIFVQDVVLPLRKKPFSQKQHLRCLRLGVFATGAFAFVFSLLFPMKEFVLMYFALTGAIYLGGVGSVIIGGLYWKRGTAYGAWAAMIVGSVFGLGGIILQQAWERVPFLVSICEKFPMNGQVVFFWTMVASIASYVGVSLLGPRHVHDMDRLLRRGKYASAEDTAARDAAKKVPLIRRLVGVGPTAPKADRFVAFATLAWSVGWVVVFIVVSVLSSCTDWLGDRFWEEFWWWKFVPITGIIGGICTLWIACGGVRDTIRLLRDLKAEKIDETDNGVVRDQS